MHLPAHSLPPLAWPLKCADDKTSLKGRPMDIYSITCSPQGDIPELRLFTTLLTTCCPAVPFAIHMTFKDREHISYKMPDLLSNVPLLQ